jgi:hypothetical protein
MSKIARLARLTTCTNDELAAEQWRRLLFTPTLGNVLGIDQGTLDRLRAALTRDGDDVPVRRVVENIPEPRR